MRRNRLKRIGLYTAIGTGVLLVVVGLLFAVEQRRAQAETGVVLSAFFSEEVLKDIDRAPGRTVELVIQRNPNCHLCQGAGSEFDERFWFGRSLKSRASLLSNTWLQNHHE